MPTLTPNENPNDGLTILDDFADVAAWTATNGAVAAHTDDPVHPLAMRITTNSGATASIIRDLVFALPGRFVSFWLKRNDANFDRLVIGLSVNGRAFTQVAQSTVKREAETVQGQWHRVTVPANLTLSGLTWADLADVRAVRLEVVPKPGTVAVVDVADLRIHDNPLPKPGVIWQFDDGRANTYDVAFPILRRAGFVGSVPVETGNLGNANRMVLAQLRELVAAGWEMNSHTVNGTPIGGAAIGTVRSQLRDSYDFLIDNGFARGAAHFIYPGGSWDAQALTEVRRHYRTGRTIGAVPGIGYETPGVADMGLLRPYYFGHASISLTAATAAVDLLVERRGFAIFCFHNIDEGTMTQPESWPADRFAALVAYAAQKGLASYVPSEVWPE